MYNAKKYNPKCELEPAAGRAAGERDSSNGKGAAGPNLCAICRSHHVGSWNAWDNFANASPSLPVGLNILPMTSPLL